MGQHSVATNQQDGLTAEVNRCDSRHNGISVCPELEARARNLWELDISFITLVVLGLNFGNGNDRIITPNLSTDLVTSEARIGCDVSGGKGSQELFAPQVGICRRGRDQRYRGPGICALRRASTFAAHTTISWTGPNISCTGTDVF